MLIFPIDILENLSSGLQLSIEFYGPDAESPSATSQIPLLPTWQTLRDLHDYDIRRNARESRRSTLQSPRNRNTFTLLDRQIQSHIEEQLRDIAKAMKKAQGSHSSQSPSGDRSAFAAASRLPYVQQV